MGRGFRIYKERYIIVIFLDCYMRFKFVSTVHGVERIEISKAFFGNTGGIFVQRILTGVN